MPRAKKPFFKVFTTAGNHRKFPGYGNNDVLAIWVRLGVLCIEKFANHTGDTFILHKSELPGVTGCLQFAKSLRFLEKTSRNSPINFKFSGEIFEIHFPNLAEKHRFKVHDVPLRGTYPEPEPEPDKEQEPPPPRRAQGSARKKAAKAKEPDPEHIRLAHLWADLRNQANPKQPPPANWAPWVTAIRLLIDRDGYSLEVLEGVIRWLYSDTGNRAGSNGFRFECHSPAQARKAEKLPQILAAMERQKKPPRNSNYSAPPGEFSPMTAEHRETMRKGAERQKARVHGSNGVPDSTSDPPDAPEHH